MTDRLYLDIENAGDRLLLAGYAINEDPVEVWDERALDSYGWRNMLRDPTLTKVTQGDHDLRWFKLHGYEVAGPWENTQVMAWVLDENQPLDLESLTKKYTPALVKSKAITQAGGELFFQKRWALLLYDEWLPAVKFQFQEYNRRDVETLRALHYALLKRLKEGEWDGYWQQEEVPYSRVLLDMECRGLPVDLAATAGLAGEVRDLRDASAARLRGLAQLPPPFNLNSPDHVREYLFSRFYALPDRLPMDTDPLPSDTDFEVTHVGRTYIHGQWMCIGRGLAPTPPARKKGQDTEGGKPSTEAKELLYKHGQDEWVQEYCLEYKRNDKLLSTYLDKFPKVAVSTAEDLDWAAAKQEYPPARIFGRFNQTGTVTGRLSSSDPNLQNIPARREMGKRVRGLFKGRFVIGDYDALEMRLMAHFSRDPRLVKVFAEGADPHLLTARALFGGEYEHDSQERDVAKMVNYAIGYGSGARTLAVGLTVAGFSTTQSVAKEYLEQVKAFYPRLFKWNTRTIFRAKELGYVETIGGRLRRLPTFAEAGTAWKQSAYGERQAVNSIVQGSAADILRRVMLEADKHYYLKLLAQVHDELIWEYEVEPTPMELKLLQETCETGHGFDLRVPLSFVPKVCENWGEK